jgi:hypothetical protein
VLTDVDGGKTDGTESIGNVTLVPEPATLALWVSGVFGFSAETNDNG